MLKFGKAKAGGPRILKDGISLGVAEVILSGPRIIVVRTAKRMLHIPEMAISDDSPSRKKALKDGDQVEIYVRGATARTYALWLGLRKENG